VVSRKRYTRQIGLHAHTHRSHYDLSHYAITDDLVTLKGHFSYKRVKHQ